jgi:hypothetical protein
MKLDIEVSDLEISTGKALHSTDKVFLRFRRPPDCEVVREIIELRSEYGWHVEDNRDRPTTHLAFASEADSADFVINCVGVNSVEVANALADQLRRHHGLTALKIQRLAERPGCSHIYAVRRFHAGNLILPDDRPF